MITRRPKLIVTIPIHETGIDVIMALFSGSTVVNKNGALERLKKEKIESMANNNWTSNQILKEYARLQELAGIAQPMPPAQHLLELICKNRRMPNINTVVDSYNIVSAETCLSIGAHDLDRITGDVRFVVTRGDERYTPLGATSPEKVNPGEYACMDDEKILCRLDMKQCNETRITKDTKQYIVYVQGNRFAPMSVLEPALHLACDNITEYCGGTYEVVRQQVV